MEWDAIVIGSGIGGLTAAAALARCGRRVLVLEQHFVLGGMTQTFERRGFRFATGLHYIGGVGPQPGGAGSFGRLLGWLGDGSLRFAPLPAHFDTVRLRDATQPGGEFRFSFGAPESGNIARLKALFPDEADGLDRYAQDFRQATRAARQMFALHGLPKPVAMLMRWLKGGTLRNAAQTTLAQALAGIRNPMLRQLLGARGGDYGLAPADAPLMLHASVMGSYTHGAWYPVGGPQRFAESLGATVRAAGGELRTSAAVAGIEMERGRTCGVRLQSGSIERAPVVISAMGAANTAAALPREAAPGWQAEIRALKSSGTYVALFLGFEGDIRTAGIDGANHWIYESAAGPDALDWQDPAETDAPSLFVSFGSVNDPAHTGGFTAEVLAPCGWEVFERWKDSRLGARPEDYEATKSWIEQRLLAQFRRLFPALADRVAFHELATPLSHAAYANAPQGAMYGLRMTAGRLLDPALHVRTPVPGLFLAGQDVASLGIQGAAMGGFMAAASIEPRLWKQMSQ
jgi:all-trans-retinol 13,14-reductase